MERSLSYLERGEDYDDDEDENYDYDDDGDENYDYDDDEDENYDYDGGGDDNFDEGGEKDSYDYFKDVSTNLVRVITINEY